MERDGLLLHRPPGAGREWTQETLAKIKAVVPWVAIKAPMSFDAAMQELARLVPGDWSASEDPAQDMLVLSALPGAEAGKQHVLHAWIVAAELDFEGRAVRDVLKHKQGAEYWLWSHGWQETGSGRVMHFISDILMRRMRG